MKKTILKSIFFISLILLINGCSRATLNTNYNNSDKTTSIQLRSNKAYIIKDSKVVREEGASQSISMTKPSISIYSSNGICNIFTLIKYPPLERNQYYTSTAKDSIYARLGRNNCTTQEFDGLEFHNCSKPYIVSFEDYNSENFRTEIRYLYLENKECFNDIKRFVLNQPKKEKVFIDSAYSGLFYSTMPEGNNCTKEGIFEAKIVNNNINISTYYKDNNFKNKKLSFNTKIIENNKFIYNSRENNLQIKGTITKDQKFIGGIYKKGSCKGAFEANRF